MLHVSSRTIKLAGASALAGLMMTVAVVAATRQPEPAPERPADVGAGDNQDRLAGELDRCATITMPDSGCEAAWAENRRRFFRQSAPEPEPGTPAPVEATAP